MPPMIIVVFTSWMESRMKVESSRTTCSVTPGGSSWPSFVHRAPARRPPPPPCWRPTASARRGRARAARRGRPAFLRLLDPVHHLGQVAHVDGRRRPRASPGCARCPRRVRPRAATRTSASVAPRSAEPAGASTFSLAQRLHHLGQRDVVGLEPRAVHDHLDLARATRPRGSPRPRRARSPAAASRACPRGRWRPAGERPGALTATETMGRAPGSMRWTMGSSISRGRWPRIAATLPRMSWDATWVETSRWKRDDVREALLRGGLDVLDALDGVDRLLDLLGDLALDRLRRARPGRRW